MALIKRKKMLIFFYYKNLGMIIKIDQYGVYCKAVYTDLNNHCTLITKYLKMKIINKVSHKYLDMHGMPV